jgi:hypothetical protein
MNVEMVEQLRKHSAFIVRKDGPGRSTFICISKKTKDHTSHGLRRDIATRPWFIIGFF